MGRGEGVVTAFQVNRITTAAIATCVSQEPVTGEVTLQEKRAELDAVLHARDFLRCPALAKLLEYLCQKTFSGQVREIKEFSIGTEVYGKDQGFGEKRDSVVRVEVHRLRKKLLHYYETEGASHSVRILLKPGNYQPDFERTDSAEAAPPAEAALVVAPPVETPPGPRTYRVQGWIAAAALVTLLTLAGLTAARFSRDKSRELPVARVAGTVPPGMGPRPQPLRILAGSKTERSVDRFGNEWVGDRYFTGGDRDIIRFGSEERAVAHSTIFGAPDQTPFRSFRAGEFSYRIPLPPGIYELRLYFSEVSLSLADSGDGSENRRLFDVDLNDKPLLRFCDVFAEAGQNTADIRVFENVSPASDGFLKLDFHSVRDHAAVNAIELIPNDTGRALPLRICARSDTYTDHDGNLWGADRYFIGGRPSSVGNAISGTGDPELYSGQRYGHFSYRLPVPPGRYKLRLFFAERFYGPDNRGKGGIGSRVFNVYASGVPILRNFDIFKEAGANHALEKVFHRLTPNPAGRIDLIFEPVVNYAIVHAVELTPEND